MIRLHYCFLSTLFIIVLCVKMNEDDDDEFFPNRAIGLRSVVVAYDVTIPLYCKLLLNLLLL